MPPRAKPKKKTDVEQPKKGRSSARIAARARGRVRLQLRKDRHVLKSSHGKYRTVAELMAAGKKKGVLHGPAANLPS